MSDAVTLQQSLRSGTRVVIAVQIVSQVLTVAVLAVLYRLLGPEPYGLLGMVMPLLFLLRIVLSGGLDVAAVQRSELNAQQVSALFWLNQILGLATAALAVVLAPWLAWFFGTAELRNLTVVLAGTSMAVALGTQHQALLQRKLHLGRLAVIRLASQGVGGAAGVVAACLGWGVWALAVQQYVELLALAALAWWIEPWRPAWTLRRAGTRPLMLFGGYYMLSNLMFYLTSNADKILLGFWLGSREGPVALGLYGQAFNLMMKPVHVVITPLTGIMLPALSRSLFDRRQYAELLQGFFRAIGLVMLPAAVGLVIVAHEAMRVLGGERWTGAGPILAVLGASVLAQGFFNALGSVFASVGRPRRLFVASALIAVAMIAGFVLGFELGRRQGNPALGVAAGYTITLLAVVFPPYLHFCLRTVGLSWTQWLSQLRPAAVASLGMGLAVLACQSLLCRTLHVNDLVLLLTELTVGVLTYAALIRRELRWLIELGRNG